MAVATATHLRMAPGKTSSTFDAGDLWRIRRLAMGVFAAQALSGQPVGAPATAPTTPATATTTASAATAAPTTATTATTPTTAGPGADWGTSMPKTLEETLGKGDHTIKRMKAAGWPVLVPPVANYVSPRPAQPAISPGFSRGPG